MNDHLTALNVYLKNNKDLSVKEALQNAHALLGEAIDRFPDQAKKPKLWLQQSVTYNWPDEKYRERLNAVFLAHDVNGTSFPWWEVIQILLQLLKVLLSRA